MCPCIYNNNKGKNKNLRRSGGAHGALHTHEQVHSKSCIWRQRHDNSKTVLWNTEGYLIFTLREPIINIGQYRQV